MRFGPSTLLTPAEIDEAVRRLPYKNARLFSGETVPFLFRRN
jgi:hypothetical protein